MSYKLCIHSVGKTLCDQYATWKLRKTGLSILAFVVVIYDDWPRLCCPLTSFPFNLCLVHEQLWCLLSSFCALDQSNSLARFSFETWNTSAQASRIRRGKLHMVFEFTVHDKYQRSGNLMQQTQRDLARQDLYESMQALVWGTEFKDDLLHAINMALD